MRIRSLSLRRVAPVNGRRTQSVYGMGGRVWVTNWHGEIVTMNRRVKQWRENLGWCRMVWLAEPMRRWL